MSRIGAVLERLVPGRRRPARRLLALDLETTGFDPEGAEIIAIGTVPVVDGAVRIGATTSTLVRPANRSAVEGIVAHHLRPSDVVAAPSLADVLPEVLAAITESDALLVHHAPLDVRVLERACEATGLEWPSPPVVDTVELIGRVRRRQRATGSGRRLPRDLVGARQALGLPPHQAHDAAADAIATAELYLALTVHLGG
ncbi:MAG: 3'-5' exonuclease [Nitriliruptoraceae bacterium]